MTRTRLAQHRAAGLDHALQGMFRALENRPVPGSIASVVDQLDEGESEEPLEKRG